MIARNAFSTKQCGCEMNGCYSPRDSLLSLQSINLDNNSFCKIYMNFMNVFSEKNTGFISSLDGTYVDLARHHPHRTPL